MGHPKLVRPNEIENDLPDAAGVSWHHGLAGFAAEGFAEFGHVLDYAVHAELPRRVRVRLYLHTLGLRTG